MKYAHRSTRSSSPVFLQIFVLLGVYTFYAIYVQRAKWKNYWLIEVNIRKTLQGSVFSFIVLILAKKAVLHFLLIMLDYMKRALRKKQLISSNAEHFTGKSRKY